MVRYESELLFPLIAFYGMGVMLLHLSTTETVRTNRDYSAPILTLRTTNMRITKQ